MHRRAALQRRVYVLDAQTFKVLREVKLPGKPVEAIVTSDGDIVGRDRKSGELLLG